MHMSCTILKAHSLSIHIETPISTPIHRAATPLLPLSTSNYILATEHKFYN